MPRWIVSFVTAVLVSAVVIDHVNGQDAVATAPRYSPAVEEKAKTILQDAGLRVSGSRLLASETASISKTLSSLGRDKRQLRMLQDQWSAIATRVAAVKNQLRQLSQVRGQLSMQLANVAGRDAAANNRIVGLLNANQVSEQQLRDQRDQLEQQMAAKRAELNESEAAYTEVVLESRKQYEQLQTELQQKLQTDEVVTAMKVMKVNAGVTPITNADDLLASIDRRLQKVEQEVFREEIPLEPKGKSLMANVVIGDQSIPMVVDTGASLLCLPAATADDLGITLTSDDPEITLVMADGRTISGRKITLPKVRVGTFEATDVDAAVLPPDAVAAEALLGMTYLSNFRSEIDSAAKTLRLTRVE